jgi:hypothetical protein
LAEVFEANGAPARNSIVIDGEYLSELFVHIVDDSVFVLHLFALLCEFVDSKNVKQ